MLKQYLVKDKYSLLILLVSFVVSSYTLDCLYMLPGLGWLFVNKQLLLFKGNKVDNDFLLLAFTIITYSALAIMNNNIAMKTVITRSLPAVFFYVVGFNLVRKNRNATYWYVFLLFVASFTALSNIYVGLMDSVKHGFITPERMFGDDSDDFSQSTSLISTELIPIISCIGLYFDNPSMIAYKRLRWFGIILAIFGELCAVHYVSRAGILMLGISALVGLIYRSGFNRKTVFFILATIIAFVLFLQSDAYMVFELKNETGGDITTGNGRDERMLYWLGRVVESPMGIPNWLNTYYISAWAHNFWIDFAKECGWIPGIALVIFSLKNLYYVLKIAFIQKINKSVAHLVLLLGIAFFLALFTEPTMQGAPLLMFTYFIFCGIVKSIYKYGEESK